jgi:hypothetical protein
MGPAADTVTRLLDDLRHDRRRSVAKLLSIVEAGDPQCSVKSRPASGTAPAEPGSLASPILPVWGSRR